MAEHIFTFRLLLISPSDVARERERISNAVIRWNAQIGDALKAHVDLVRWETHGSPDLSGTAQDVLDRQIVDGCDLGLAVFWSRVGTPTGAHVSGSVEEISRLRGQGKRVMVYFCDRPIPANVDLAEYQRLRDLRAEYEQQGLIGTYVEPADLELAVLGHLSSAVKSLLPSRVLNPEEATPLTQALTADASASSGGSWTAQATPLGSRQEMYAELKRLLARPGGPLHIRSTSLLPPPYRLFDKAFVDYSTNLAARIAAISAAGGSASYSLVVGFPLLSGGSFPDDRIEVLRNRIEIFRSNGAVNMMTIFHTAHQWLLDVLTINDEVAIIGFPAHASDPHLRHAVEVKGQKFVSQFVQWFDTCVLPSASLVDLDTIALKR